MTKGICDRAIVTTKLLLYNDVGEEASAFTEERQTSSHFPKISRLCPPNQRDRILPPGITVFDLEMNRTMPVKVKIKMTEPIWRTVGSREITVELPDGNHMVAAVLDELCRLYPRFADEIYSGSTDHSYHYGLFVNDQMVNMARRYEVGVKDGDQVLILLPVAGGSGINA